MADKEKGEGKELHIFVNRRKFGTEDGVTASMTGAAIAALVEVAADNAVIREGNNENGTEIAPGDPVTVKNGAHFLVTRRIVDGG
ncbi:MAG TPA: hypothetical protein VIL42_07725 [Sphingomicrobium sp.]|jgi:hypothetical protein